MTNAIRQKILRIMELALLLNPTKTQQEYTGVKPTIFVEQNGHVSTVEIRIYAQGWKSYTPTDQRYHINYSDDDSEKVCDECIAYLEALYAEWKDKAPENV
jgi:hypothetical protein